jgi:glutathione synthase/RimK-type ligase-like ATP-grasp enzyme
LSIRRVKSKWAKTAVMMRSDYLREHMPPTRLFNQSNLQSMLEQYAMVYVKPVNGTFGKGVMRVERTAAQPSGYRYQLGTVIRYYSTIEQLYMQLSKLTRNRMHIVQKGIHLLRHRGRRFDIRVMVQKNTRGVWEATGIIGRLAYPGKIVTNYHSGGTPMALERLMSGHASAARLSAFDCNRYATGCSLPRNERNWCGHRNRRKPSSLDSGSKYAA